MKIILFLASAMLGLSMSGCCSFEQRTEPAYPHNVSGWKERKQQGVRILGDFALKKGNSTDNGKIQVKIIDLIPPDSCAEAGAFQRQARARIQFVRLSDNKVLLDDLFAEKGTMTLSAADGTDLYEEFGISVIYIYDTGHWRKSGHFLDTPVYLWVTFGNTIPTQTLSLIFVRWNVLPCRHS